MTAASGQASGATLTELLDGLCLGLPDVFVKGIELDSRAIRPGDLFIAVSGSRCHGLCYLDQAVEQGAVAVVYDPLATDNPAIVQILATCSVPMFSIGDLNQKTGEIAARFYRHPSEQLNIIGITGTNGKTSCSHYIAQALAKVSSSAVIGTLGWGKLGQLQATDNTTPDAIQLQKCLTALLDSGTKTVAMEVSSHGLVQGRINGTRMTGALLTNISRDHLDYHGNMEAYVSAKLTLLQVPGLHFVVINLDDPYAQAIITQVPESVRLIGFSRQSDCLRSNHRVIETITAQHIQQPLSGIYFDAHYQSRSIPVVTRLVGDFNIDNLLATLAVLIGMDYSFAQAARFVSNVQAVPGRMECFSSGKHTPLIIIDYAHTPASLANILLSAKALTSKYLWLVFGCGGDRDAGKRAEMGCVAEATADHIILTDDNPRYEAGDLIIKDILSGCTDRQQISICRNRKQAILSTIKQAESGDVILIAGKGHESTQNIKGISYPFSDQQVVRQALFKHDSKYGEQG